MALDGTGLCLWQLDIPSGKLVIFNRRWGAMLGFQEVLNLLAQRFFGHG
jgi:hypothetical protein